MRLELGPGLLSLSLKPILVGECLTKSLFSVAVNSYDFLIFLKIFFFKLKVLNDFTESSLIFIIYIFFTVNDEAKFMVYKTYFFVCISDSNWSSGLWYSIFDKLILLLLLIVPIEML